MGMQGTDLFFAWKINRSMVKDIVDETAITVTHPYQFGNTVPAYGILECFHGFRVEIENRSRSSIEIALSEITIDEMFGPADGTYEIKFFCVC